MKLKMTIGLLICFLLAACGSRIEHPAAPAHQQSVVENFELDKNEARVHFFSGELFLKNNSGIKMNESIEFYVNDKKIGLIGNNKEYIAISLPPGSYNFKWMPIIGSESCLPEPFTLSLSDNELIFLTANMRDASSTSPAAYLFGAIGAALGTNVKVISYFEQDIAIKDKINEYKLISLIESFK